LWRATPPVEPMTDLDGFVSALFHPDPIVRSDRRNRLAPTLIGWREGDLLDLIHALRRVERLLQATSKGGDTQLAAPQIIEAHSSISRFLNAPMKAAARSDERTAVIVAAAATTSALSMAPRPIAAFLNSLLMNRT
jgi:hypothetical protein